MNNQMLPTVEQVQKQLEEIFYKRFKDDRIRDYHVEAVLEAVAQRLLPLPPDLILESTPYLTEIVEGIDTQDKGAVFVCKNLHDYAGLLDDSYCKVLKKEVTIEDCKQCKERSV